ncbi:pantothenate kinase [Cyanobacterium aponinum AL20118]|uniref:Type III pantothenate kinase n=1 Tax=Cyanobacterium aponinum AL20115 TaxID=3090662 RepID=A0AAF0ZBZ4_9CHRO|nr:pantothenate kinase [Cyanobacterium aponinum]WPF89466.1 pantothenate kinase [Cyanobacterium aponinum AL20115]
MENWLGLMIGNSRLHWAYFQGKELRKTWNTLSADTVKELEAVLDEELFGYIQSRMSLYVASVVPSATKIYLSLPQTIIINYQKIPLHNIYDSMGCDRILALWGGGCHYGFPCLVIDSGTALTFSGADEKQNFQGGAIMPGVRLQLQTLFFNTAALPEVQIMGEITPRWATNTPCAIQSGVVYTIVAGIKDFAQDWFKKYPQSKVVLTGGDALLLSRYLADIDRDFSQKLIIDPDLIFWGMQYYQSAIEFSG